MLERLRTNTLSLVSEPGAISKMNSRSFIEFGSAGIIVNPSFFIFVISDGVATVSCAIAMLVVVN